MIGKTACAAVLSVILLAGCASRATMGQDESWQMRLVASPGLTGSEKIALEVVKNDMKPVQWGSARAYLERREGRGDVVAVEMIPRATPTFVKKVRFLIRDGLIQAESYPEYFPVVDKTRQGHAREVALLARRGQEPQRPEIYDGKYLYKVTAEEGCSVTVTEYDMEYQPIETYLFDVCDQ